MEGGREFHGPTVLQPVVQPQTLCPHRHRHWTPDVSECIQRRDARPAAVRRSPNAGVMWSQKGADMGDRGGKKDKDKNKKQETKKHQEEAQRKQDNKARPEQ